MWGLIISFLPWKVWLVLLIIGFIVLWWLYRTRSPKLKEALKKDKRYCSWQQWFQSKAGIETVESSETDNITSNVLMSKSVPLVGRSKSETLAINAFSQLLETKGADISNLKIGYRPSWLYNPETRKNLEFDAYYPDWKIALEYNGIQHYVFPNKFHLNTPEGERQFTEGYSRDKLKRNLANQHNVCLITVPYHVDTCIECARDPSGFKFQRHTDQQKWERLVKFIDAKINYCMASQLMQ